MDTRSGRIYDLDQPDKEGLRKLMKVMNDLEAESHIVPAPAVRPGQVRAGKVGRNGPCPCGSGKKFKTCCMGRAASASERRELAEALRLRSEALDAEKERSE